MTTSIQHMALRRGQAAVGMIPQTVIARRNVHREAAAPSNWLDAQTQTLSLTDEGARPHAVLVASTARRSRSTRINGSAKRLLDIVVALCALGFCAPLMIAIALLIKLDSPGPVFFRQDRRGLDRRSFRIYKFRTMKPASDESLVVQAKRNDDRVTRCGSLLRRSSLDELPQLINVLQGDMSIVGPRPHAMHHDAVFERHVADYVLRFECKPGIIGLAQLNGARGEIRHRRDIVRRTKLDLLYQRRWSIALDIVLICIAPFRLIQDALDRRSY